MTLRELSLQYKTRIVRPHKVKVNSQSREITQSLMMQLESREQNQTASMLDKPKFKRVNSAKTLPTNSQVCHWLTSILYPLGRRILMPLYFGRLKVTGQDNIPKTGPVIFAPTHRSRWDGLTMAYAAGKPVTGRDLRFMVSQDEMKGVQGWFLRRLGGFPVNTKQPGIGTIRHSVELLRCGEVLVMFPEGNIFRHGQVNPIKPGMARIALQAESNEPGLGLKIVPVSIRYSEPIPHQGSDIHVQIGSPLEVAQYCTQSAKKGAQQLTTDLEIALKQLDQNLE